jgi:hypothetical protein
MEICFGRWCRLIAEIAQTLMLIFVMAAHIVLFSIAINELTGHAFCTVGSMALGTLVSFLVALPRTLKGNSYFSTLCEFSTCPHMFRN